MWWMTWFARTEGKVLGPLSDAQLLSLADAGRLKGTNFVRREESSEWVVAGQIPELVGHVEPAPARSDGNDRMMRVLLPVGRSGLAIAAGYLGLFAIVILPAPFALLFGILAIRDLRRHPEKHGMGRAIFAIVMGSLFSLLLLFIILSGAGLFK